MPSKQTSQVEKVKEAARELETDDNEKRFDERLGKIARQKPAPPPPKKKSQEAVRCRPSGLEEWRFLSRHHVPARQEFPCPSQQIKNLPNLARALFIAAVSGRIRMAAIMVGQISFRLSALLTRKPATDQRSVLLSLVCLFFKVRVGMIWKCYVRFWLKKSKRISQFHFRRRCPRSTDYEFPFAESLANVA
jgi:hypothetical protein